MIPESRARKIAEEFLAASRKAGEPEIAIDWERGRVKSGVLVAPYNSVRFLQTRAPGDQLLDCWPILVDMSTGRARFGLLEERDFWR
ncbi:YrhB domain-containing protein [Streptomyces sp. F41]|uniref:YrhB domain-containing protein n=1 Tax=Streptomyces sp. F41 TaxID=1795888 RepID=UPI0030CAA284